MALREWDVRIGKQAYMLASPNGIVLGNAFTEPGKLGELASAVVQSFHGGIGHVLDAGQGRYLEAIDADCTMPGAVLPAYGDITVGTFTPTSMTAGLPTFVYQEGSDVFVVAGQSARKFTGDTATPALTTITFTGAFVGLEEFSGSGFLFNNQMIFGIVLAGLAHQSGSIAKTGATVIALDGGTNKVSYGASGLGKAFWINEAHSMMWAPQGPTGATFPGTSRGPQFLGDAVNPTWCHVLGRAFIIFTDAGQLLGADTTALWTVVGTTTRGAPDPLFGRRSAEWMDIILVPSKTGLWAFHAQNITTNLVSPNFVQTAAVERLRGEVVAVGAAGPYGFFSQRVPGSPDHTRGYQVIRYQQANAIHDLFAANATNEVITDMLTFYNTSTRRTRLYYLVLNTSTGLVSVKYRELRLPGDMVSSSTGIATKNTVKLLKLSGAVKTAFDDVAQNMTKFWLQVRGHWEKGSAGGGAKISFANVAIDGKTVTLADVTTSGDFAVPFTGTGANRLGREMTGCDVSIENAAYDTVLLTPLVFDYLWIPAHKDSVTLSVLVGSNMVGRSASLWQDSARELADATQALQGTITTLEFNDDEPGDTAWSILVEDVQLETTIAQGSPGVADRVAKILIRRL